MRRISAALVAAALLSGRVAGAQPILAKSATPATASIVDVYLPACDKGPVDTSRLVELLRIELGAIGVADVRIGQQASKGTLDESVLAGVLISWPGCDALAQEVTIEVVDRVTSKTVSRTMALNDVPFEERHRAVAIAIAELLQASWVELEMAPRKTPSADVPPELRASIVERLSPAPVVPTPSRTAPESVVPKVIAPELTDGPSLAALAMLRAFPSRNTALLGATAALSVPLTRLWSFHAGADAGGGDTQVALGSITMAAVTGSVGLAARAGTVTKLEVGPRFHAGYAWASGSPAGASSSGSSYSHFIALAALSATLRVPATGWTALLGIDVGYTLAEASFLVDDARAAGIGGAVIGGSLGAAFGI